jgi:predicted phosphodiesterase
MTDVHANLPALVAALKAIRAKGYDILVHTGDTIALGPYPSECLELLLDTPRIRFVMGNNDAYFVNGVPEAQRSSGNENLQHQLWTHAQLNATLKGEMAQWPYVIDLEDSGARATFVHYALDASGRGFVPFMASIADRDAAFSSVDSSVVFFGHDHSPSDLQGRIRYVNPGSLGMCREPVARYCSVELSSRGFTVEHLAAEYDTTDLFRAYAERHVPARQAILRVRFGRTADD